MEDRPWFKFYDPGVPHTLEPYPDCTLLDVVGETVRQRPEQRLLIFKGASMTYGEVARLSHALAAALAAQGVQKGDRLATLLPNCPQKEYIPAHLRVLFTLLKEKKRRPSDHAAAGRPMAGRSAAPLRRPGRQGKHQSARSRPFAFHRRHNGLGQGCAWHAPLALHCGCATARL